MKKAIFVMVAASAMLASCSNEEALQVNNGRAIEFRHGMASRAADLNVGNLNSFMVSAWVGSNQYFGPVQFTKAEGQSTFSSATSYYWPGDGSEVNFTAFAPYDLGNATISNGTVSLSEFTVNDTKANQVDFIVGGAKGSNANQTDGVQINFAHKLSQIEIKAKSGNTTYNFEISEVKLVNIPNKGSFDGTTWTIAQGAEKATYSNVLTTPVTLGTTESELMTKKVGDTDVNNNLILIPQQLQAWKPTKDRTPALTEATAKEVGAYIAVKLKVTSKTGNVQIFPFEKDGQKSEWAAVPVGTNWEAGKKYTYVLDFTSGAGWVAPEEPVKPEEPIFQAPIKFTVAVSDWSVEGAGDQAVEMKTEKETPETPAE